VEHGNAKVFTQLAGQGRFAAPSATHNDNPFHSSRPEAKARVDIIIYDGRSGLRVVGVVTGRRQVTKTDFQSVLAVSIEVKGETR
jgi:hypothetical protein